MKTYRDGLKAALEIARRNFRFDILTSHYKGYDNCARGIAEVLSDMIEADIKDELGLEPKEKDGK